MSRQVAGLFGLHAEASALLARYAQTHDPQIREELVQRFMPLARHLAGRYRGPTDRDDLVQVASVGLLNAIERFDPSRGSAFSTFAVPTILGELRRYYRDYGWMVRVPRSVQELSLSLDRVREDLTGTLGRSPTPNELAKAADVTVEQVLEALDTASAKRPVSLDRPARDDGEHSVADLRGIDDPGFVDVENRVFVDDLLALLPERDQRVLRLRFDEDLTQAEIGRRIGLSQMHVSRIIRQSIAALQQAAHHVPASDGRRL
jgi:RNA polymerase sigma-B factor